MGQEQTEEHIRRNIVKVMDRQGETLGTGFFVKKELLVTCHHNIWRCDDIYVGRMNSELLAAEWLEEFSDMESDLATFRVKNSPYDPLVCANDIFPDLKVCTRGFTTKQANQSGFILGKLVEGVLGSKDEFYWEEEKMEGAKPWNKKPVINVDTYPIPGEFFVGYSGAPVWEFKSGKIVGMFEAKDDQAGYIIPIGLVLARLETDRLNPPPPPPPANSEMELEGMDNLMSLAKKFFEKGEYSSAVNAYDQILHGPPMVTILRNKAIALQFQEKYKESIVTLRQAIEIDSKDWYSWLVLGRSHQLLKQLRVSLRCFNRAIKIQPNYAYTFLYKGRALHSLKKYEAAIKCYSKAIKIESNFALAWLYKAQSLRKIKDYEKSLLCCNKALGIEPNDSYAWVTKADILNDSNQYPEALDSYERAIEIDPLDGYSWVLRSSILTKLGRLPEALKSVEKAIEIDSLDDFAWLQKGIVFQELGKKDEAQFCFRKSESLSKPK